MRILFSRTANKSYQNLPQKIKEKADKQFAFLLKNSRYPSLRTKKMKALNKFEARIDYHNRFTFRLVPEGILIMTIGPHDEGLGKK